MLGRFGYQKAVTEHILLSQCSGDNVGVSYVHVAMLKCPVILVYQHDGAMLHQFSNIFLYPVC